MKTTRSIDEITTEVKIGCTDAMGGVHKVYIPLTEEAKAELLATILASMGDMGEILDEFYESMVVAQDISANTNQWLEAKEQAYKTAQDQWEQAIKKIFEGGE